MSVIGNIKYLSAHCAVAIAIACFYTGNAMAQILTPDRSDQLCVPQEDKKFYVDADALFEMLVREAETPFAVLALAADDHAVVTREDFLAIIQHGDIDKDAVISSDKLKKQIQPAIEKLKNFREDFYVDMSEKMTSRSAFEQSDSIVTAAKEEDVDGFFEFLVTNLTQPSGPKIVCNNYKPAPISAQPQQNVGGKNRPKKSLAAVASRALRIRGETSDLAKLSLYDAHNSSAKQAAIKTYNALSAATLSYRRDEIDNESVFAIKGAVGFNFPAGKLFGAKFSALPYTTYERSQTTNASGATTVHIVSPGLLAVLNEYSSNNFHYTATLATQAAFDLEQDSEKIVFKGTFEPVLTLAPFNRFPNESKRLGRFAYITPKFVLLAEAADVLDAGTSAELAGFKDYYALGFDSGLAFSGTQGTVIENFGVKIGYRRLEFVGGDIGINNVSRFTAELIVAPPGIQNYFLSLKYEDGENAETFQNEEFWNLSIGLRY